MALVLFMVLGAAAPAPIQRNQFSTNVPGEFVRGNVGFTNTSGVNGWITITSDGLRAFNRGGLEIVHIYTDNNLSAVDFGAGFASIFTNGAAAFTMKDPSQFGLSVAGASGQSVDLFRILGSSGNLLAAIHSNGGFYSSLLASNRAVVTTAGTNLATATGTQDGTRFLRDDNTYAVPAGTGLSGTLLATNLAVYTDGGTNLVSAGVSNLVWASTVDINFNVGPYQYLIMTNDTTFTGSRLGAAKAVAVKIFAGSTNYNLVFPSWTFIGSSAPSVLASNKTAVLSLTAFDVNTTNVIAAWAVQP